MALRVLERWNHMGAAGQRRDVEVYADATGWTGHRELAVLGGTRMPAILVELGFVRKRTTGIICCGGNARPRRGRDR